MDTCHFINAQSSAHKINTLQVVLIFFSKSYTYYICLRIVICPKCPQPCRWSFMLSCSTHSPLRPPQVRNCSSLFFLTRRRPPHRPYPPGTGAERGSIHCLLLFSGKESRLPLFLDQLLVSFPSGTHPVYLFHRGVSSSNPPRHEGLQALAVTSGGVISLPLCCGKLLLASYYFMNDGYHD